ncbi:MAG TPA: hypothetical protein VGK34_10460 [Armatimonadota bacterium]|jgi:hypothetical protein
MTKRKVLQSVETNKPQGGRQGEPLPTHRSYTVTMWTAAAGLVVQLLMGLVGYGRLPSQIPSVWVGWIPPGTTVSSWVVFVAFPGAQLVVLLLAWFSGRNEAGKKVMQFGKSISLVLLTLLITILQSSLFTIQR